MAATGKSGCVLLIVASLLLAPIGGCTAMAMEAKVPADPCCPKHTPAPSEDCAEPGCHCIDAKPVPNATRANRGQAPVLTMPEGRDPQTQDPPVAETAAVERNLFTPRHRFLAFHQLLI